MKRTSPSDPCSHPECDEPGPQNFGGKNWCRRHRMQEYGRSRTGVTEPCMRDCGRVRDGRSTICALCKRDLESRGMGWCPTHGECPVETMVKGECGVCRRQRESERGRGLRLEIVDQGLQRQKHRCAICERRITRKTARVDHDHACCKKNPCERCRRELLCHGCNTLLGKLFDSPMMARWATPTENYTAERLESATRYLEHWESVMIERGVRPPRPLHEQLSQWLAAELAQVL